MNTLAALKELVTLYGFSDYSALRDALSAQKIAFKLRSDIITKSELSFSRFGRSGECEAEQITRYTFFIEEKDSAKAAQELRNLELD